MRTFLPKALLSGVALIAAVASTTASAAERRFTRDGENYRYTIVDKNNRIVLTGENETTGTPFELIVRGDWVSGNASGTPVSFRMPGAQAKLAPVATQIASR